MKKYLLPENGTFYKANLHCHTVLSDGRLTPEQVRELYMSRGYSIVAFTDHNAMSVVDKKALSDHCTGMDLDSCFSCGSLRYISCPEIVSLFVEPVGFSIT